MRKNIFNTFAVLLLAAAFLFTVSLQTNAQTRGKIVGMLTYPSEYIPPEMILCVENTSSTVCSNSKNKKGFLFKLNHYTGDYQVSLPAGKYFIYAAFPEGQAPTADVQNIKAYYNEFVKCGVSVVCKSKKKIEIKVAAGKSVNKVIVGDWWS